MHMARFEALLVLSAILHRFDLKNATGEPVQEESTMVLKPHNGVPVLLEPRMR